MIKRYNTNKNLRTARVRARIANPDRPRLSVFRSNKGIYAQVIDDGKTLAFAKGSKNLAGASDVGNKIAQLAVKKGVKNVVFDRGPYKYHGRVKALAQAAKEGGLNF